MLGKWEDTRRCFFSVNFTIWILMTAGWLGSAHAQTVLKYWISGTRPVSGVESIDDPLVRESFVEELLESIRNEGYPMAFLQRKTYQGDTLFLYFVRGHAYSWIFLEVGNLDEGLAHAVGYEPTEFQDNPFNIKKLNLFFDRVLKKAQNRGRPFASIKLDNIEQAGNKLKATLDY